MKKQWLLSLIKEKKIRHFIDLLETIKSEQPGLAASIIEELIKLQIKLVMNGTREVADARLGRNMVTTCEQFIGVSPQAAGNLSWNDNVWRTVRKRGIPNADNLGNDAWIQMQTIFNTVMNGGNATPRQGDPNLFRR
jgi:hypothetical protein